MMLSSIQCLHLYDAIQGPAVAALSSSKYPILKGLATLLADWMAHLSHNIGGNCETLTKSHSQIVTPTAGEGQLLGSEKPYRTVETSVLGVQWRQCVTSLPWLQLTQRERLHRLHLWLGSMPLIPRF